MLLPLVVAFVAVALGALLALGPREGAGSVRPIRLFALVAAVAVIAGHLLPEAWHELGVVRAVAGFVLGLSIPAVTERVWGAVAGRFRGATAGRGGPQPQGGAVAALEIAFAGLVVHRFGDGLSMGAYSRADHGAWAQAGVVLALALHIVPVTTVMILAIVALRGRHAALARAVVLAVSTMAGVIVAGALVADGPRDVSPWISAVVAGLLLHIVVLDAPGRHTHSRAGAVNASEGDGPP